MMSTAPTRLKATTNAQKSGPVLHDAYGYNGQPIQHAGREVTIGSEHREARGQIGADDAWKEEDEPEEAEAVQRSNGALCFHRVHRFEPGQRVHGNAKQPGDITSNEMYLKDGCRGHFGLAESRDRRESLKAVPPPA
jgi:hypothetical protein